ncbi:MAG: phage holin family protein [Candidatus Binatia bacterium]
MALETRDDRRPSLSSLISGILLDAKELFAHELQLAKLEVRQDIRQTKTAVAALCVGLGTLGIGITMIMFALVHLIAVSTGLALWQCYGLVGVLICVIGFGLLMLAKKKAGDVDFIPEKTAEAVKEDVGWIKTHMMMPNKTESTRERH